MFTRDGSGVGLYDTGVSRYGMGVAWCDTGVIRTVRGGYLRVNPGRNGTGQVFTRCETGVYPVQDGCLPGTGRMLPYAQN